MKFLEEAGFRVCRSGSREICSPPPTDTDEDWFVYASTRAWKLESLLKEHGFVADEIDFDDPRYAAMGPFRSWRKADQNVIIVHDRYFYDASVRATKWAKRFNLTVKQDRKDLFADFRGVDAAF